MVAVLDWHNLTEDQWNDLTEDEWGRLYDAESPLLVALQAFEDLVVSSVVFRSRVGTDSTTEAKRHVYYDWQEGDALPHNAPMPLAVIREQSWAHRQIGQGDGPELDNTGGIVLMLVDEARERTDHKQSRIDFVRWAGRVCDEMAELSGSDGAFQIASRTMEIPSHRTLRKDRGKDNDHWELVCLFEYNH